MYARLSVITTGPDMRPQLQQLADHLAEDLRTAPGFRGVTFLMGERPGEFGSFSLWDSKEEAEAAGAVIRPHIAQSFTGLVFPWLFEVYEPTGGHDGER